MKKLSRYILTLDALACLGALLFILALALNVHNRQDIVNSSSALRGVSYTGGSVGSDAPLQYPFIVAILALLIGMWLRIRLKHPKWSVWALVALVILASGFIIWAAGLSLQTQNQLFMQNS